MPSNPLHLTLIKPDGSREALSFEQDSLVLGSGPSAALRLTGPAVSAVHAMLKVENGSVSILDLGSEAGITVNGEKVAQATLTGGETIGIGENRLVFGEEAPAATQPAESDVGPLEPRPFSASGSAVKIFSEYRDDDDQPTGDDRLLEVAMVWSDTVIGVRHLEPGSGRIVLGGTGKHDFVVAADALPSGEHVLVEPAGRDFQVRDLDGNVSVLPLAEQRMVVVGEVGFVIRWVKPSARLVTNPWASADFYFTKVMSTSMVAHVAFFAALLLTPIHHDALSEDLFGNPNRFAKLIIAPEETAPKKKFKDLSEVEEVEVEQPKFGEKFEVEEETPDKKGAPVVDVDKREQDKKKVMKSGLLAALDSGGAGSSSNVFSSGGMGAGINNALGGLQNGTAGDAMGAGGLGSRGAGAGGGGSGLGIGGLGTKGGGGGGGGYGKLSLGNRGRVRASVKPSDAQVVGNMDPAVIAKVVRRHQNEIKYCYEREIQKDPNLAGKVAIMWVIDATGGVATASVAQSSLGNSNVENCILSKVKRWKFPMPKGGGVVQVTYPWLFKPSA